MGWIMPLITIYTQSTCGYCNELKDYLKKRNIEFVEKDISKDKEAWNELVNKYKARATPLLVYGDKQLLGFNPDELDAVLNIKEANVK